MPEQEPFVAVEARTASRVVPLVKLPARNDAMGWLQHLYDCLAGDHGPLWHDTATEAVMGDNDGTWTVWRSIVEERGRAASAPPARGGFPQ